MRRGLAVFVFSTALASVSAWGEDWKPVWADEFHGPSVDWTTWTAEIGNGAAGWGNNDKDLQLETGRRETMGRRSTSVNKVHDRASDFDQVP